MGWQLKKSERDLDRELSSDLELEEEQRERGVPPEQATHAAHRAFGNEALIKEQTREAWGWVPLERVSQDVRYALRQLVKKRGFSAVCVFTLAVGVGATTAISSIVHSSVREIAVCRQDHFLGTLKVTLGAWYMR